MTYVNVVCSINIAVALTTLVFLVRVSRDTEKLWRLMGQLLKQQTPKDPIMDSLYERLDDIRKMGKRTH